VTDKQQQQRAARARLLTPISDEEYARRIASREALSDEQLHEVLQQAAREWRAMDRNVYEGARALPEGRYR
jgi:guanylate kinase